MTAVLRLIGALLAGLHSMLPLPVCRDDWLWSLALAGGVLGLLPMVGSLLVALLRKGTGNRYNVVTCGVFGVIGALCCVVLPWLGFVGVNTIFTTAAHGETVPGVSASLLSSIGKRSCFVGDQRAYLGNAPTVYEVLLHPTETAVAMVIYFGLLVVIPVVGLLFMIMQSRVAMRRGQKWPSRLLWIPFVALVLGSAPLSANVMASMWLGFVPALLVGTLIVFLVGPPPWAVINAGSKRRSNQREPAYADGFAQPAVEAPDTGPRAQPQAYQQQLQSQASSPPPSPESTIYPPWHYGAPQPSDYPSARRIDPTKPQPQGQSAVGQTPARPPSAPTTPSPAAMLANLPQPSEQLPKPSGALANTPGPLPFMAPSTPTPTTSQRDTDGGGRFKKVRELGSGGFGKVWLAVDQNLDRTVAVKFAHAPDTETEQRMLREGRALAAVRHPNCVRIYDIVSEPDGLGIVMEYIEGPSLSQQVRGKGRLDDVAAARLWSTMAGALDAAHAKGVLHRDVKPSNVLIDPEGAPHLIDFGIARSKGDSTLTATGMMMGTPDFLAPETATGKPATPASDAWQLAATVSFALAGQPPRGTRDDVMSALMAAANGAELTELPTDSAHYGLLRAALHTDPTHRPTLDAIREHLGQWLAATGHAEEGPVTAAVAPSESTTKSNIKRS